MSNKSRPTITFTPLAVLKHSYFDAPRIAVVVGVPGAAAFEEVTINDALHAGVKIPPNHNILMLPRDLNHEPPLEAIRPKGPGEEVIVGLGYVSLPEVEKVGAVFGKLAANPANDTITMMDERQLGDYMHNLNLAMRADPQDTTGIGGLLNILRPTQRDLAAVQERTFPTARPFYLH